MRRLPGGENATASGGRLRRLDLTSLSLFEAVAESGSLSAACARLNLAVAAGSRRIADLEATLGTRLLERGGRGMRLTPAGEAALERWRGLAEGLRRLLVESGDIGAGGRVHLHVAASVSVVVQFLPGLLGGFLSAHPACRLDLREMTSRDAAVALRDGAVELALLDAAWVTPGLEWRPWQEDRLVAVVPPGHPLWPEKRGAPLPFAALLAFDLVGLDHRTALHAALRRAAAEAGQELRLRVQVGSFEAALRMVRAGLGAAVLPESLARSARDLAALPLADPWARRQHVVAARSFAALTEPARLFAEYLAPAASLRPRRKPASRIRAGQRAAPARQSRE
ncbi:LysR family transcriptional regulator [Roseomonas sp. BN140053]|uniref:LysR family transcriptional regulator n=1 Tax=Roseomonas sp. BN140053 TaxID=3391898 RepID=UPI0039EB3BA2